MSTNPITTSSPLPSPLLPPRASWKLWVLVVGLLLCVAGAVAAVGWFGWRDDSSGRPPTFQVRRGPLTISVSESGTIKNREQAVVKCEVEGKTTILSLIAEGTQVQAGDKLVELDSSNLEDQKVQQQIVVQNAEAAFIQAREGLAVAENKSQSDVSQAELDYKFAEWDLKKYTDGEYPQELQQAEAQITIAREELQRAQDKLEWSRRLAKEGYLTRTELQADELAAKKADLDQQLAKGKLQLLKEYTHKRKMEELRSAIVQTKMALERVKRKAAADVVQAKAELTAKESEFERQKGKLAKTIRQLSKCLITAPVAGMAVHATTGKASWRGNESPLEEGREVREREELIYLPTTSSMSAEVKVHESSLRKVRTGLPVTVTADALPGRTYYGSVGKIGLLPDAVSRMMNPDLKVYSTEILIDGDGRDLRPGMTCRVEIVVAQYEDALYVPVQAVVRVREQHIVYVPGPDGPQPRKVRVGLDNNRMAHVLEGLQEGEHVLLSPPLEPSSLESQSGPTTRLAVPPPSTQPTQPTSRPAGAKGAAKIDYSKLRTMTPEQRRKFLESLTPEQREALRKRSGSRGGPGGGSRRPRSEGQNGPGAGAGRRPR